MADRFGGPFREAPLAPATPSTNNSLGIGPGSDLLLELLQKGGDFGSGINQNTIDRKSSVELPLGTGDSSFQKYGYQELPDTRIIYFTTRRP